MVDWYVSVMEQGFEAKDVMKNFHELKINHTKLQKTHKTYKEDTEEKVLKLEKKVKELRQVLKK